MSHRFTLIVVLCLVCSGALEAQEPDPLFRSDDRLEVRISGPIAKIVRQRSKTREQSGTFSYVDDSGETVTFDVKIRSRGNFRRDRLTCPFPPIRLNFKKSQVKDTLFDKQDKLKLVTHCRNRGAANHNAIHREYLAYRIFNEITDASFRVRPLEITWVEAGKTDSGNVQIGFLIESDKRLAKRIDRKVLDVPRIKTIELDPAYTNQASMFQFLIANTDFSPIAAAPRESCCHNGVLMAKEGLGIYSVPYDFDMSGFADAPYAVPNERFKLRSVRDRKYRGRCVFNAELDNTVARYMERRAAIEAVVTDYPWLDDEEKRESLDYIAEFYEVITDPKAFERDIRGDCVG